MPAKTRSIESIAAQLAGGPPLDFKVYEDNTLVIIGPNGKKLKFAYNEYKDLINPPKPPSKPKNRASKPKK
jgi:hypothetical protein